MKRIVRAEKRERKENRPLLKGFVSIGFAAMIAFAGGCSTFTTSVATGAGVTTGVMGAGMGMEAIRELLFRGIEGIDQGQSVAGMQPAASAELSKSKKVALEVSSPGMAGMMLGGGGAVAVLEDALSGYLLQMGYEVASKDVVGSGDPMQDLVRAMQPGAAGAGDRIAKLRGKGVDLLISGAVSSSTKHEMKMTLFLGRSESEVKTLISTASIRVTSLSGEKVILTATVTYKKGKTPQEVAQDLANVIQKARASPVN